MVMIMNVIVTMVMIVLGVKDLEEKEFRRLYEHLFQEFFRDVRCIRTNHTAAATTHYCYYDC